MLPDKESDRSQLQAINGIGPKIEKRLKREGVFTLSQLASMSSEDIVDLCGDLIGVTAETAQGWIDEAVQLVVVAETEEEKQARTGNGLHYAVFHVKLMIDDAAGVRRTEIHPLLSKSAPYKAAGWQPEELIEYIQNHAKLAVPSPEAEQKTAATADPHRGSDQAAQAPGKTEKKEPTHPLATLKINDIVLVDKLGRSAGVITFRANYWRVQIEWTVTNAQTLADDDSWTATLYLNPIGRGEEIAFAAAQPIEVSDGSWLTEDQRRYTASVEVNPTLISALLPRVYRLAVSIVGRGEGVTRLPMGYREGEIVSVLEPA